VGITGIREERRGEGKERNGKKEERGNVEYKGKVTLLKSRNKLRGS
jgi:hypothetical protein